MFKKSLCPYESTHHLMPAVGIYGINNFPTPSLFGCSRIFRLFYIEICLWACYLNFQCIYVEVKSLFKDSSGEETIPSAVLYTAWFYIFW